jgi:hypothetical protein
MTMSTRGKLFGRNRVYAGMARLHIRHGDAARLGEFYFRAQQQSAEAQIGDGHDDVEIFVHVTVMQKMMAIETIKNPGTFDAARFRQVHAPVHIFISAVVAGESEKRTDHQFPAADAPRKREHRNHAQKNQQWSIPPRHRDGFFIVVVDEVVSVVGFESVVMDDGVRLKSVAEIKKRAVHEITMQRPFKKRGENGGAGKTDRGPKYKVFNK